MSRLIITEIPHHNTMLKNGWYVKIGDINKYVNAPYYVGATLNQTNWRTLNSIWMFYQFRGIKSDILDELIASNCLEGENLHRGRIYMLTLPEETEKKPKKGHKKFMKLAEPRHDSQLE